MKIKYFFIAVAIISTTLNAQAECTGPVVNGRCLGTTINNGYNNANKSQQESYRSNTGNQYQYDLSKPTDQNRYSTDLDAQRRDQMNINPTRQLDRGMGQFGGGILGSD